jgi:hypothetical protein
MQNIQYSVLQNVLIVRLFDTIRRSIFRLTIVGMNNALSSIA